MSEIRKSVGYSLVERHATLGIQFVASVLIARLLTPEEIGIFSVGFVVVGMAHSLRDFGVTNYIVQERDLTASRLRAAYGVSLVIGWLIAAALFMAAAPADRFYAEPGVGRVVRLLAVTFLLIPPSCLAGALMRRQLQFDAILKVNVAAAAAQSGMAIVLAFAGVGYMSLAWGAFAGAVVTLGVSLALRPAEMPLVPSLKDASAILKFGSTAAAGGIVTTLGLSAPDLVMGRMLGFDVVGLYSRAAGLVSIFRQSVGGAITNVALPAFAERYRDAEPLCEVYLRSVSMVTALAWPFFGFLGIMAFPIVRLLYGPQWDAAVPLAKILCLAFAIEAITTFAGSTMLAMGNVGKQLRAQLLLQPLRFALVLLASLHSVTAVAAVQVFFYVVVLAVFHRMLHGAINVSANALYQSLRGSFRIAAISLSPPLVTVLYFGADTNRLWLSLVCGGLGMVSAWFLAVYLFKPPVYDELNRLVVQLPRPWR